MSGWSDEDPAEGLDELLDDLEHTPVLTLTMNIYSLHKIHITTVENNQIKYSPLICIFILSIFIQIFILHEKEQMNEVLVTSVII